MIYTPDWWPHNVESWLEVSEYFSDPEISDPSIWQQLTQGQSNYNYKLSLPTGSFFVQSVNPRNILLLPNPERRVSQLELSRFVEIKPWLVDCYVDNIHLKISKWFDAVDNSTIDFDDDRVIAKLAIFLVNLHSVDETLIKKNGFPILDAKAHFTSYYEKAVFLNPHKKSYFDTIFESGIKLVDDFNPCRLCHNDLSPSNLLWNNTQNKLKVIDWEYSCIGDPCVDLASLILNCQLNSTQQSKLLEIYTSKLGITLSSSKLEKMTLLCQNLNFLWLALQK
ncbi:MAG: phosphotransferase [Kangiellaceae bacterium]|nr:phosphotransferase [Kangiellaceae bacterium]